MEIWNRGRAGGIIGIEGGRDRSNRRRWGGGLVLDLADEVVGKLAGSSSSRSLVSAREDPASA